VALHYVAGAVPDAWLAYQPKPEPQISAPSTPRVGRSSSGCQASGLASSAAKPASRLHCLDNERGGEQERSRGAGVHPGALTRYRDRSVKKDFSAAEELPQVVTGSWRSPCSCHVVGIAC